MTWSTQSHRLTYMKWTLYMRTFATMSLFSLYICINFHRTCQVNYSLIILIVSMLPDPYINNSNCLWPEQWMKYCYHSLTTQGWYSAEIWWLLHKITKTRLLPLNYRKWQVLPNGPCTTFAVTFIHKWYIIEWMVYAVVLHPFPLFRARMVERWVMRMGG